MSVPSHALAAQALDLAVERAQGWFFREEHADGYWWAELESNATMDAEYLLLTHFLGARDDAVWRGIAMDIRGYQRDDGSWALYHGAPGDLSTSIECYFALKLAGDAADAPHMARARAFILSRGGLCRARTFTRIWLALFGQFPWQELPIMPPELMLLPRSAPLNIYSFSSWARGTIVPLLLLMNDRPVRAIPDHARLDELRLGDAPPPRDAIDRFFRGVDRALRAYEKLPVHPLRERARAEAERWILSHQEADGSWALYHGAPGDLSTSIECYFALKLSGDAADAPHMARARSFILSRGGLCRARTFTRIWLALFGQFPWEELPVMPPELMLLPRSAPLNIYSFSSWARGTIVPLLLLMNDRPVR
ncbi:MAG TPA: prenyltransferase/squalene oxidase repeat-containing protein, partial [Myxococcales bacterium]|nr:prenyltransferase/squalene oxidase repeat-containing protein [Myxococcales bacterium]